MSKPTDLWETPARLPKFLFKRLINEKLLVKRDFTGVKDVCATADNTKFKDFISEDENGLVVDWGKDTLCWCNPPYSYVMPWIKKAIYERDNNNNTTVMLLKNDTSPKWFLECKDNADAIAWLCGKRIKFMPPPDIAVSSNNFSSLVVVFDPELNRVWGSVPRIGLIDVVGFE